MIVKVLLSEDNYIINYSFVGEIGKSMVEVDLEESLYDDFITNFTAYHLYDGVLQVDPERAEANKLEESKARLRALRKSECFSIINRGKLWYDNLTEEQLAELAVWYQAWLDVTETLVIPEKPEWLL